MQFQVDLGLWRLRCVQPDEGEDEPYLWTFFFKLDGSMVQQVQPDAFQLVGSVQITAGHGAHRNLSAPTVVSGEVDHRDSLLTPAEQAANDTMFICVSRAACPRLVLEL